MLLFIYWVGIKNIQEMLGDGSKIPCISCPTRASLQRLSKSLDLLIAMIIQKLELVVNYFCMYLCCMSEEIRVEILLHVYLLQLAIEFHCQMSRDPHPLSSQYQEGAQLWEACSIKSQKKKAGARQLSRSWRAVLLSFLFFFSLSQEI